MSGLREENRVLEIQLSSTKQQLDNAIRKLNHTELKLTQSSEQKHLCESQKVYFEKSLNDMRIQQNTCNLEKSKCIILQRKTHIILNYRAFHLNFPIVIDHNF